MARREAPHGKELPENLRILESNDICRTGAEPALPGHPDSVELETRTDLGKAMTIRLEEPTRRELEKYIDSFDAEAETVRHWRYGIDDPDDADAAPLGAAEHRRDYEDYLARLRRVAKLLA